MSYLNPFNALGQTISNVGTLLHLPEMNMSERLGYGPSLAPQIGPQGNNSALQIGNTVQQANQQLGAVGQSITNPAIKSTTKVIPVTSTPNTSIPNNPVPDSNGVSQDIMNELNSQNAGNQSLLDAQAGNLGQQRTQAQGTINAQGTLSGNNLQSALDQALKQAASQQDYLNQTQRSTRSQNVRDLNALQQQASSRYGQGSSAGQAMSELISQEFMRANGDATQGYTSALAKVFEYQAQSEGIFQSSKAQLDQDIIQKLSEIDASYNEGMLSIASSRNQSETARSQARISLMQDAINNARAIQNYKIEAQTQLEVWKGQQQGVVQSGIQTAKDLGMKSLTQTQTDAQGIQNTNQGFDSFLNNNAAGSGVQANASISNDRFKKTTDEMSGLNPWTT